MDKRYCNQAVERPIGPDSTALLPNEKAFRGLARSYRLLVAQSTLAEHNFSSQTIHISRMQKGFEAVEEKEAVEETVEVPDDAHAKYSFEKYFQRKVKVSKGTG